MTRARRERRAEEALRPFLFKGEELIALTWGNSESYPPARRKRAHTKQRLVAAVSNSRFFLVSGNGHDVVGLALAELEAIDLSDSRVRVDHDNGRIWVFDPDDQSFGPDLRAAWTNYALYGKEVWQAEHEPPDFFPRVQRLYARCLEADSRATPRHARLAITEQIFNNALQEFGNRAIAYAAAERARDAIDALYPAPSE